MNTYLAVTYDQKDLVKALGARWDATQRKWYVPTGLDLAPFSGWLPTKATQIPLPVSRLDQVAVITGAVAPPQQAGVSLSKLLAGVEQAVANAFNEGIWTRVEVLNVTARNKHVYLEVSERDATGAVVAQARAAIWARTAERIVPAFERDSGAQLAPGIKLLVLAKPVFRPQYGFSLEISGIDAAYTVGDLEAQKRRIREQLKSEGIFDRNRQLEAPWDFSRVLVVAPPNAAGLGDFTAEADRLHTRQVCEFIYVYSRFQGEGAPSEILAAINAGISQVGHARLDALVIIRGGGAVTDLAWLNDFELAKFICLSRVPVLTGIGHERDRTVLDEVAHKCFDTPSKVIAAIEKLVEQRTREAKQAYEAVLVQAAGVVERMRVASERLETEVRTSTRATLSRARSETQSSINQVRVGTLGKMHEARLFSDLTIQTVRDGTRMQLQKAKQEVPTPFESVKELSAAAVRAAKSDTRAILPLVLELAGGHARRASQNLESERRELAERAQQTIQTARAVTDALVREVTGQGPNRTLRRGFALVKSDAGKTVTSAAAARDAGVINVSFNDGVVTATVQQDATDKE